MATQKELARLARVSAGTVSHVISGTVPVSEKSRAKVLEAIRKLQYEPNLIARSLKTNRTNTLGIVIPDITVPFFAKLIRGAETAAREHGYFLMSLDSENQPPREAGMLSLLRSQRVDGILLVAAGGYKWHHADSAPIATGPPIVCLDRLPDGFTGDSVCLDDRAAASMAVSHLLSLGHRRIAILTGPQTLKNEQERLRGYRRALHEAGVPVHDSLIWVGGFEPKEIARICQKQLLRPSGRPSALLATNGVTGMEALRSIYASGLSTPRDIAFVTIDEILSESLFRPGITSVVQPAFEIGYQAVEAILKRIDKRSSGEPAVKLRLPATLVVRESSGGYIHSGGSGALRRRSKSRALQPAPPAANGLAKE